jgi:hypothetical protein
MVSVAWPRVGVSMQSIGIEARLGIRAPIVFMDGYQSSDSDCNINPDIWRVFDRVMVGNLLPILMVMARLSLKSNWQ